MDLDLVAREFAPETVYLNTATMGLPPARTVAALHAAIAAQAGGRTDAVAYDDQVRAARGAFARIAGVAERQVAVGATAAEHVGVVAEALPDGAEVLLAAGEFTSVTAPFQHRPGLRVRVAPLERLAEAVTDGTALVAVSVVQSADGRVVDLAAVREATRRVGARLLLDATQAAGWLPLAPHAAAADYLVCAGYKWLLTPRGVSFLAVAPDAMAGLRPLAPGWYSGEDPWASCYDAVRPAQSARRFDHSPAWLPFVGAASSLAVIEELGPERIGAHDRALAARCREGLHALGYRPVGADSAIVSVAGLGDLANQLAGDGVRVSARAGGLRLSFHLYNSEADVDRLLDYIPPATRSTAPVA
ncbi:aminotransferase class V-fold PLP-dependent enzyme [Streptacidiphilus jiangxiensis]|uniref:Selenocysteine lyase/Cysteine desulfurase n=1 Tax=Streptacidiphilus jiangxiensis TaxID=235985 RepID=A0A1H7X019_STRJI|nr:aminotransferase class V-fold PLP-dependent enzyme [Streptacidiphilus jiangxiensis]SEM27212.1 Selenocysteine lyase/Cysteine desulfurase [Streptacidiphilus jiangxiensis]